MAAEGVRLSARETGSTTLISRIFHNNSLDIILSLSLGLTSSLLAYTSPYFLREILTALTDRNDQQERKSAYVYAVLALFAQCIRAEVDLQQLWHERRCIVRARSQLMGEVYEKALKRRDLSGSTNEKGASSGGKIVQLMSADAMRVANQLMTLSSFATAPVELVIAITFLYQLLGWTALAGLSVVGIALPMNHYLVKRRIVVRSLPPSVRHMILYSPFHFARCRFIDRSLHREIND
jgi:ABC-type multidrug transport system fused ATPase/permease subunit